MDNFKIFRFENKSFGLLIAIILLISGCAGKFDGFVLGESFLADRQIQTRKFSTDDEKALLVAASGVLQDMGYKLEESETKLGVLVASKTRDATKIAEVAIKVLYAFLLVNIPIDHIQTFKVSLITSVSPNGGYLLRATFQRTVINDQNRVTLRATIHDKEIYKDFFDKLSKSVFLEAQKI